MNMKGILAMAVERMRAGGPEVNKQELYGQLDERRQTVFTSPGRLDGKKAGPVRLAPAAMDGKFQVAEFANGDRKVLFSDGSFRNVHNRRQPGLSGRQRRIIRKEESRRARRVAAVMHKIQARDEKTPQE